jgi:hypothetical protein
MNISNPIEKVWNNPDLKSLIEDFLKCIWCSQVPINYYPTIRDWDLLTNGKCINCLRKEYSAYF